MKCQTVHPWLLAVKSRSALPQGIQAHLRHCSDCEQRWQHLERIDGEVRRMDVPPANPAAKEQLWQRLDQMPRSANPAPLPTRRFTRILLASTAAASLLMGLGLGLVLQGGSRNRGDGSGKTASVPRGAASPIVSQVAQHGVRLAAAATPAAQLDAVAEMADDLRAEAFRLARQGTQDDLVCVAQLYDQVVLRGVAGRVHALPPDERRVRTPPLVRQLRTTVAETNALSAELMPAVAEFLRPVARAAEEGAAHLEADSKPPERPASSFPSGGVRPLLASLVLSGLRLAEEPDRMRRANISSEVAQQLAPAIVVLASNGEAEEAAKLGDTFGSLLDQGVAGNLEDAEEADPNGSRQEEAKQVRQGAVQAAEVFERNLSKAAPAARKGLERALNASAHGRERAMKPGKGNAKPNKPGPPRRGEKDESRGPNGKHFIPPGQRDKAPR